MRTWSSKISIVKSCKVYGVALASNSHKYKTRAGIAPPEGIVLVLSIIWREQVHHATSESPLKRGTILHASSYSLTLLLWLNTVSERVRTESHAFELSIELRHRQTRTNRVSTRDNPAVALFAVPLHSHLIQLSRLFQSMGTFVRECYQCGEPRVTAERLEVRIAFDHQGAPNRQAVIHGIAKDCQRLRAPPPKRQVTS